jgi:hypothetical protein
MKEINIKIVESVLTPYEISVEELADLNGYPKRVVNTSYVPPVGDATIPNPDYIPATYDETMETGDLVELTPAVGEPTLPNPDYVPAVGEPEIDNPERRTQYLAKKILEGGIQKLINRVLDVRRNEAQQALRMIDQQEKAIVADIISQAEITVVE